MRQPKIFTAPGKFEFIVLIGISAIVFTRPKEEFLSLFTLVILAALAANFVINWRSRGGAWASALGRTFDIEMPQTTDGARVLHLAAMVGCLSLAFVGQLMIFYDPPDLQVGYLLMIAGVLGFTFGLFRLSYRANLLNAVSSIVPETSQPGWKIRRAWLYVSLLLTLYLGARAIQPDPNGSIVEFLLLWIPAMIALGMAFYHPASTNEAVDSAATTIAVPIKFPRWEVVLIVVLLAGAMLARFVNLETEPGPFDGDEANFAQPAAVAMIDLRINPFLNGWDSYSNMQSALMSISMKLLGHNHFAARVPSALMGALTIVFLYLLGRELYGWQTGLLTALFAIGWTYQIQFSRLSLNQSGDAFFGTVAMYFLVRGLQRKSGFDYALAGMMLALAQMFYLASIHLVVVMVGYLIFLFLFQRKTITRQWRLLWIIPFACIITIFPRLYYLWYTNLPFSSHTYPNIVLGGELSERIQQGADIPMYLLNQVAGSYLSLFSRTDGSGWYGQGSNIMSPVGGPLLLLGVVVTLIVMWKRAHLAFPLLWGAGAIFITGTLSTSPPMYQRLFSGSSSFALLAGIGLSAAAWGLRELIATPERRRLVVGIVGGAALVFGLAFYVGVHVRNNAYLKWHTTVNSNLAGATMVAAHKAGKQVVLVGQFDTGVEATVTVHYYMAHRPFANVPDDYAIEQAVNENMIDLTKPLIMVVAPGRLDAARQFVQQLPNPAAVKVSTVMRTDVESISHYVFDSPGITSDIVLNIESMPSMTIMQPTPIPPTEIPVAFAPPGEPQQCVSIVGEGTAAGYSRVEVPPNGSWMIHLKPISDYLRYKLYEQGLHHIAIQDRTVPSGAIGPGINYGVTDYMQSVIYQQLLTEHCRVAVIMPWVSDLSSMYSDLTVEQRATQYVDRLGKLLYDLLMSNTDITILLIKYYPANVSEFMREADSGVTEENIAVFNKQLEEICDSKNPDYQKVTCIDPTTIFADIGGTYLLKSVTYSQMQNDLAPEQTLDVADMYFRDHPDATELAGDGIRLSMEGKSVLADDLVKRIQKIFLP